MDWFQYYRNFVGALAAAGVRVDAFVAPRLNWHAKVAVRLDNGGMAAAAIVGSSNLTGPAYRESGGNWNYECDVTLWRSELSLDAHFRVPPPSDPFEQMIAVLDPNVDQRDEAERLRMLLHDLKGDPNSLVPLDCYRP
jgi:hypothetical protein